MSTDDHLRSLISHEEYYIPSADLFILVEQVLFRVHRYFFDRESKWFGGKLEAPASPGGKLMGSDPSTAIILDELSADDFAKFLWVFYNKTYSLYEAPVEDWAIILTLSNRWSFPGVKALAIRELQKKGMSDVKRIKLYKENHVDRNYLIPCYARLCEREEPLTAGEGLDLGMIDVIQIAAAREQARSSFLPSGARSPLTPTIHGADLDEVIRQVFQIAPHEPGFNTDETTHITGDPNHTTTDSQNPIGTSTETGDQKTNQTHENGNGATTDHGDPSKAGGDSNANSNQNHSSSTTTATGKGNNNTDETNASTPTSRGRGGNNNNTNSTKSKHKK